MMKQYYKKITVGEFAKYLGNRAQKEDGKIAIDTNKIAKWLEAGDIAQILQEAACGPPIVALRNSGSHAIISGHHRQELAKVALEKNLLDASIKMNIIVKEGMNEQDESRHVLLANDTNKKHVRLQILKLKTDVAKKVFHPIYESMKGDAVFKVLNFGQKSAIATQLGSLINNSKEFQNAIRKKSIFCLKPGDLYAARSASDIKDFAGGVANIDLRDHKELLFYRLKQVAKVMETLKGDSEFNSNLKASGLTRISVHFLYLLIEAAFAGKVCVNGEQKNCISAGKIAKAFADYKKRSILSQSLKSITSSPEVITGRLLNLFGVE